MVFVLCHKEGGSGLIHESSQLEYFILEQSSIIKNELRVAFPSLCKLHLCAVNVQFA